jgi:hypothetical protein
VVSYRLLIRKLPLIPMSCDQLPASEYSEILNGHAMPILNLPSGHEGVIRRSGDGQEFYCSNIAPKVGGSLSWTYFPYEPNMQVREFTIAEISQISDTAFDISGAPGDDGKRLTFRLEYPTAPASSDIVRGNTYADGENQIASRNSDNPYAPPLVAETLDPAYAKQMSISGQVQQGISAIASYLNR